MCHEYANIGPQDRHKRSIVKTDYPELKDGCLDVKWSEAAKKENWGSCLAMRTDDDYRLLKWMLTLDVIYEN